MRKIIITVIATFFMIAPFEKAKGQRQSEYRIVSVNFPTANILTGINTRLSVGVWRFDVFAQIGGYLQIFEEQMTTERWERWWDGTWTLLSREEFHSPRFERTLIFDYGIIFRITDRHWVTTGLRGVPFLFGSGLGNIQHYNRYDGFTNRGGHYWRHSYLGYIYRINLLPRLNLDLNAQLGVAFESQSFGTGAGFQRVALAYHQISLGARLNFEIVRNLKLNMQLEYAGRYNVRQRRWFDHDQPIETSESILTRNLLDFSIGIHYHIPIFGGQQQQIAQRPSRQRVAPHQRALPCPPGQMRHLRSWDRPSSVFNHPSAR